jgi:hypothetical protein
MRKIFASALLAHALCAHALDGVSIEAGRGGHQVDMARVAGEREWDNGRGYWELSAGAWDGGRGTIYDLGFTPVLRTRGAWYAEGAIGAHWLSSTSIEPGREFSTHFQFGDHLGVGWRGGRYDLALRLQHLSNAGLRNPNPGINFLVLRLRYELR